MSQTPGDHFQVSVGGSVGGHMVVGNQNQITSSPVTTGVTAEDLAKFATAVNAVKTLASTVAASPEQAAQASAQLEDLHKAVTADKPDLNTLERVRNWFVAHLPTVAGAVTGLLVHPVVGALVKSAGDAIADEFKRRFGGSAS